jgi:hypothetical protein
MAAETGGITASQEGQMNLPPEIQAHVDAIRALLGVPPCQIVLDIDRDGVVQAVEPRVIFRRRKTDKTLDREAKTAA